MKVQLSKTVTEKIEIEVDFPIFRKHDVSGDDYSAVIYSRIDEGREISITKTHRYGGGREVFAWELEIDSKYRLSGELDYALGRSEYASTAEEFATALEDLKHAINAIPSV